MALTMKAGRGLPVKFVFDHPAGTMTVEWVILPDDDQATILGKLGSMLSFINSQVDQPVHLDDRPVSMPNVTYEAPAVPNGWELIAEGD